MKSASAAQPSTIDEPLPLVTRIVKFRVTENEAKAVAKKTTKRA